MYVFIVMKAFFKSLIQLYSHTVKNAFNNGFAIIMPRHEWLNTIVVNLFKN